MVVFARKRAGEGITGIMHHSDRGVQYHSMVYIKCLDDCTAVSSVRSCGNFLRQRVERRLEHTLQGRTDPPHQPMGGPSGNRSGDCEVCEMVLRYATVSSARLPYPGQGRGKVEVTT